MAEATSDSRALSLPNIEGLSERERAFCGLILCGNTAKRARELQGITEYAYQAMRLNNPAFANAVRHARAIVQEEAVDQLDHIAENEPDVQRAKLRSDNIKWKAGKYNPQLFGDRLDLNVTQTIDIGSALAEARARVLRPMCDPVEPIDVQVIDVTSETQPSPIDKQSIPAAPDIFS